MYFFNLPTIFGKCLPYFIHCVLYVLSAADMANARCINLSIVSKGSRPEKSIISTWSIRCFGTEGKPRGEAPN